MNYTVGDEVRRKYDGKFGFVVEINEEDKEYMVDFDGDMEIMTEDELC